ncbi:FecR family protein [Herminiimonas arsenitoxidans]|uniref:FecR family protein n=1 Tax=Herminiimonas arsenitoxidans TaxID=1809410 RepID=UPI001E597401|nr:FecR family protein [Herminiimonas arsenitoxidans]
MLLRSGIAGMNAFASHTAAPVSNDPIVEAAIDWIICLRSGEAGQVEHEAFKRWRLQDVRHDAAIRHLEQVLGAFDTLPVSSHVRSSARRALLKSPERRKLLRNGLALLLLGSGAALLTQRITPLNTMTADLRTATGQRKHVRLADGSQIWLNARSAADIDFDEATRRIHLRSGEIIVDVASDAQRPFIVQSAQGSMRALGTRFLVRQEEGATVLAVLHSSVRIDAMGGTSRTLVAGQSARFDQVQIDAIDAASDDAAAWMDGFIEVHDRPLSEVIAALRPYRSGFLRLTPQAGALRVTGTFPLDDSGRTLAALAETLPIAIRRRTDYWVSIEMLSPVPSS